MPQPTTEQKLAAANAALVGMIPPVTSTDISPRTVAIVIELIWSQLQLLPELAAAAAAPAIGPMFCDVITSDDPADQADIAAYNAAGVRLADRIRAKQVPGGSPTS